MGLTKRLMRRLLTWLYRVEVRGLENMEAAGERTLIVANHTSFLDAVLLAVFLPGRLTFAVNTHVARNPLFKPFLALARIFPMDPTNPLAMKSLIRHLRKGHRTVIFPEGRITVTGALMKIYDGPGLAADSAEADVLPVRIDGAQYSPFSRLKGRVRLRWFPQITLTVLPPRPIRPPEGVRGRARRREAGRLLSHLMNEMVFETTDYRRTIYQALLNARRVHGGDKIIAEDIERRPMSYNGLIDRAMVLGHRLARETELQERVGLLLPNGNANLASFIALQAFGRVPAMLNYTVGAEGMISACRTATIRNVITSRRFVEAARLTRTVESLRQDVRVLYLEDLAQAITLPQKILGFLRGRLGLTPARARPDDPGVVLFTSGSEGTPKGVVLSHANLLANRTQIVSKVDFNSQDVILNALPMFHSFGLTAGTLLPLLSGMKTFFYPSPLHYRIVPEIAYDVNATVLFGTNTFLAGYARFAHPYDFYSVRYAIAGAEKLQEETRRIWSEKFGVRIFEGYGATETSPVLAVNTPMESRAGTVGRFLPGVKYRLEPVPGIDQGGRLFVSGPNIMLGYLLAENPGELVPTESKPGPGWYDTGDIVALDEDGYVSIRGRAKRFAKIGGEMVSLAAVEELAAGLWPGANHVAVNLPDAQKGEQVVLLTDSKEASRGDLMAEAKARGIGEINVPRTILTVKQVPLLGTGKVDFAAARREAEEQLAGGKAA